MTAVLRVGQRVREATVVGHPFAGVVRDVGLLVAFVQWDDGDRTVEDIEELEPIEKIKRPTRFTIRRISIGSQTNLPWCVYDTARPSWIGRCGQLAGALLVVDVLLARDPQGWRDRLIGDKLGTLGYVGPDRRDGQGLRDPSAALCAAWGLSPDGKTPLPQYGGRS